MKELTVEVFVVVVQQNGRIWLFQKARQADCRGSGVRVSKTHVGFTSCSFPHPVTNVLAASPEALQLAVTRMESVISHQTVERLTRGPLHHSLGP